MVGWGWREGFALCLFSAMIFCKLSCERLYVGGDGGRGRRDASSQISRDGETGDELLLLEPGRGTVCEK